MVSPNMRRDTLQWSAGGLTDMHAFPELRTDTQHNVTQSKSVTKIVPGSSIALEG